VSRTYRAPQRKIGTQGRKDIKVISAEQVAALADAAVPALEAAIYFAAYTGVRLGELLAIDFDGPVTADELPARLDVAEQETPRQGKRKKPKGEHERTIVVPPQAVPEPVWGRLLALSRTSHWRAWDAARSAVGLDLDWHELRHFAATWWLSRGAEPWDVAIQLGHRDGGELVRTLYGHPEEQALDRLQGVVAA
jgi:integrase